MLFCWELIPRLPSNRTQPTNNGKINGKLYYKNVKMDVWAERLCSWVRTERCESTWRACRMILSVAEAALNVYRERWVCLMTRCVTGWRLADGVPSCHSSSLAVLASLSGQDTKETPTPTPSVRRRATRHWSVVLCWLVAETRSPQRCSSLMRSSNAN